MSARDAEAWWDMRQSYTASLALSSVATYLLGIGDRHLNNILVVQNSGQVYTETSINVQRMKIVCTCMLCRRTCIV